MMMMFQRTNLSSLLLFLAASSVSVADGFVMPQQRTLTTQTSSPFHQQSTATALQLLPLEASTQLMADAAAAASTTTEMSPLLTFFLQSLISNGVPSVFVLLVIGVTAKLIRGKKDDDESSSKNSNNASNSPVSQLYDDLYGDQDQGKNKGSNMFSSPFGGGKNKELPKNTGVPAKQFLQITNLNQKYDSYKYSMVSATQSKAAAAAQYRQAAWERAWGKSVASSSSSLSPNVYQKLQQLEQKFLKEASGKQQELVALQAALTGAAIDEELEHMGMTSVYQLDPADNSTSTTISIDTKPKNKSNTSKSRSSKLAAVTKLQGEMQVLELDFLQDVVAAVGPTNAAAVRTALLGGGSLLAAGRPLTTLLGSSAESKKKIFVTRFPGDTSASQVANLREEVTAIVQSAQPNDEAVLILQTGGGTVTGYGLAAAQLMRLKDAGLTLTIVVEQVAASGGYMMACIADKIIASPFAVLGSIGVISDMPNVYERLKKEGIEFQTVTAGKYKRTLTPTKKVTKEDIQKSTEEVEEIFFLFRDFVKENRPSLDIDKVATGETWFGTAALERNLCDEIKTVDDVLGEYIGSGCDVFEVAYKPPTESPFGLLLPIGAESSSESSGPAGSAVRWLVKTVASAVKAELSSADVINKPTEERFMAKDDTADNVRSQY